MAKQPSTKKGSSHQQIGLKCKEEISKVLHLSIALYGAEIWTLWEEDKKYLKSVEMWCCRRMEKLS
jgi:hypothetical protein